MEFLVETDGLVMANSNVTVSLLAIAGNLLLGPIPNLALRKSASGSPSWLLKVALFLELPPDFPLASQGITQELLCSLNLDF